MYAELDATSMNRAPSRTGVFAGFLLLASVAHAQVSVSGRVVDETGEAVAGARVELRATDGRIAAVASSDLAGNLNLNLSGRRRIPDPRRTPGVLPLSRQAQTFGEGPASSPSL